MTTDPNLESYLSRLDKALSLISVSDRAEIVTEIKSHVIEAQSKDSGASLSSILAALGEPETVANRFLIERGLKPGKPAKSPVVKWLVIGFLGTVSVIMFSIVLIVWKFTPLLKVDETNDRVVMLGGLIDVDGKGHHLKIESRDFAGSKSLDTKIKTILIPFNNGRLELSTSEDRMFKWECTIGGKKDSAGIKENKDTITLNLKDVGAAKCDIILPKAVSVEINGDNGKVSILKPHNRFDVNLLNGKIYVSPDESQKYKFKTSVKNGRMDAFDSSTDPTAIELNLSILNGRIIRE